MSERISASVSKQEQRDHIIGVIRQAGIKVSDGVAPYKLLFLLAKAKGVSMNGNPTRIAKVTGFKREFVVSKAKEVLKDYCRTGILDIPKEFKIRGRF